jgi:hypothetical protein
MRRRLTLLIALTVMVAACDVGEVAGGNGDDAMGIARDFLRAVEDRHPDQAWSLVYPPNRNARFDGDAAMFEALVDQIDLAAIDWEVTGVREHDGHYHVTLELEPLQVSDALGVFVHVSSPGGIPAGAQLQVDIEPFGGARGVLGG